MRRRSVKFLGIVSAVSAAIVVRAASQRSQLDATLEQFRNRAGMPGLSVAVARSGHVVYSGVFGYADIASSAPVRSSTQFRAGSVSKLLTAATFGRMWEKGLLHPDEDIRSTVPEFGSGRVRITLRQLAGHLAGIRHYTRAEVRSVNTKAYGDLTEATELFRFDSLVHQPGSAYAYSSYGYVLLGAAMERRSGRPFSELVRMLVADPIMLRGTRPDDGHVGPDVATFYERTPDGMLMPAQSEDYSYKWPAGGYLSTANDLARFGSAMISGLFDRPHTSDSLFAVQRTSNGTDTGVGIGFRSARDVDGQLFVHHGGDSEGARAFLLIYPDDTLAVALLSNVFRGPLFEGEAATIADIVRGRLDRPMRPVVRSFHVQGRHNDRTIEGRIELDRRGGGGTATGLFGDTADVVIFARTDDGARMVLASRSGLVNLWLEPMDDSFVGRWGYDRPRFDIRLVPE